MRRMAITTRVDRRPKSRTTWARRGAPDRRARRAAATITAVDRKPRCRTIWARRSNDRRTAIPQLAKLWDRCRAGVISGDRGLNFVFGTDTAVVLMHVPTKRNPVRRQGQLVTPEATAFPAHIGSLVIQ